MIIKVLSFFLWLYYCCDSLNFGVSDGTVTNSQSSPLREGFKLVKLASETSGKRSTYFILDFKMNCMYATSHKTLQEMGLDKSFAEAVPHSRLLEFELAGHVKFAKRLPFMIKTIPEQLYISKLKLVSAADRVFGDSSVIECSPLYDLKKHLSKDVNDPYYEGKVMKQYSGLPCNGPLTITRLQQFLSSKSEKRDGGSSQCPEVVEWYMMIASSMRENAVVCDVGFDEGHSSAVFLLGGHATNVTVHSFDASEKNEKSRSLFRELFPGRFIFHQGDVADTSKSFISNGGVCDAIFFDIPIPKVVSLFEKASLPSSTILYHWHFRSSFNKEWFENVYLPSGKFIEQNCMQTRCKFFIDSTDKFIVRESCVGRYNL